MKPAERLTRAEGFADLGMCERAWAELEELPPDARIDSRVLELRLRIATALEKWSLGEVLVNVLESGETVARFHHAYARHLSLAGDGDASLVQIRAAVKAWSGIRLAIVDDVKIFTGACQRKKGKSSISARFWVNLTHETSFQMKFTP